MEGPELSNQGLLIRGSHSPFEKVLCNFAVVGRPRSTFRLRFDGPGLDYVDHGLAPVNPDE